MRISLLRPLPFCLAAALAASACGSAVTTNVTGPTATRCQVALTAGSTSFTPSGGTGSVTVSVARECPWSSTSQAAWIQITAGAQGQGDGTISYRVSANADPVARKAAILVGDQHADVAQDAAPCRYGVTGPSQPLPGAGGEAIIAMRTHSACAWSAAADAAWITINPTSGNGDADIRVAAPRNPGALRTVNVSIGSDRVAIQQMSGAGTPPSPSPSPTPSPAPATIDVSGRVNSLQGACPTLTFNLGMYLVRTSNATTFTKGSCKDMEDDQTVKVHGELLDAKTIRALTIEFSK